MISKRLHPASFSNVNSQLASIPTLDFDDSLLIQPIDGTLDKSGNYSPAFLDNTVVSNNTAGYSGLVDDNLDPNTIVYRGYGWRAANYACYAGFKKDLSAFSLSGLGLTYAPGHFLNVLFYKRQNGTEPLSTNGIYIGTNKIVVTSGAEVAVTALDNGWSKFELHHELTESDFTQNTFGLFKIEYYGLGSAYIETQYIDMCGLEVYIDTINLFSSRNESAHKLISNNLVRLQSKQRRWKGKTWYVIGDSITAALNYQGKVALNCEMQKYITDGLAGRSMSGAVTNITSAILTNVDIISIFLGTNDYGGGTTLGSIADAKTDATFYGYLKNAIDVILTAKPSVRLVFFTPTPRGAYPGQPTPPSANSAGATFDQYIQAIKDVCEMFSIPVLDLYALSGFNSYTFATYMTGEGGDYLHPTDTGHTRIANLATAFLESLN